MAIRAADENGKARAGFKKMNPSLFFISIQRGGEDEECRYVRRQREGE